MVFSPALLQSVLHDLPTPRRFLVAYSGGLDSMVLLHALVKLRPQLAGELIAVHINHGLQASAGDWATHCEAVCRSLDVPLIRVDIRLEIEKGESIEAVARQARYAAMQKQMVKDDLLLTAHHQDDQAETLLLQLMRGAGPSGLAAMPQVAAFGPGWHGRPLLGFSRAQLQYYAQEEGLSWIEDSSNRDERFDRNFLRQQVMPLLAGRWPAMARTLSRSARHCAEAQRLIDGLSESDLARIADGECLTLPGLTELPPPRQRAVLRAWIRQRGFPLPDTARLDRLQREMLEARGDRMPMVHWPGVEARRYRDRLYLMPPLQPHDVGITVDWDGEAPLLLPSGLGRLEVETGLGGIDPKQWGTAPICVRFRQGGERLQPKGRRHSHSLKALFQEQGIPPWQRERIPLVFVGDQLVVVGDLWIAQSFAAKDVNEGLRISWDR